MLEMMLDALTNAGKHVASHTACAEDTQKIQSPDWPKWLCELLSNVMSCLLSDQMSFQMLVANQSILTGLKRIRLLSSSQAPGGRKLCDDQLIIQEHNFPVSTVILMIQGGQLLQLWASKILKRLKRFFQIIISNLL